MAGAGLVPGVSWRGGGPRGHLTEQTSPERGLTHPPVASTGSLADTGDAEGLVGMAGDPLALLPGPKGVGLGDGGSLA